MTVMTRTLVMTLLLAVTLAGCSYQPARISPKPPVIIDDGHHGHGKGNGNFCPPGQAKKGNC
ncbi:hypothetical protein GCM10010082_17040 [Kushneria pakistanensis]|uniref:Lipoprotein n=1 Tax=Kushneria pakistanensis TaxID=1508770 RepID=A0ABQ3FHR8_9GAMM|nr:hypothetical protein [Kushneria pakistanensis]GHC24892.1 hypothetical protein GCM10010082_17040 [Kushneria pakistanensis]